MITPEKLTEWQKLCEEASSGPWYYTNCYGVATIESKDNSGIAQAVSYLKYLDADFICESRTALPELIAEVELWKNAYEAQSRSFDALDKVNIQLDCENQKLRQALEFYSEKNRWYGKTSFETGYPNYVPSKVENDLGKTAREALGFE